MASTTFNCPQCGALAMKGQMKCEKCDEPMCVGLLRSTGNGVLPAEFLIGLFPHETLAGGGAACELSLPTPGLGSVHLKLYPGKDGLMVEAVEGMRSLLAGHPLARGTRQRVADGALLSIGDEEFRYQHLVLTQGQFSTLSDAARNQLRNDKINAIHPAPGLLMSLMAAQNELIACRSQKDLLSTVVSWLLPLSGLERGYAFLVETNDDQLNLKEVCSLRSGGGDFSDKQFSISRGIVSRCLESNGSVIVDEADERQTTHSMRDMKIRSVICLPLMVDGELMGIVYADKMLSTHRIPTPLRTTLQQLCRFAALNLERCRNIEQVKDTCKQYDSYLKSVQLEIGTIGENLEVISQACAKAEDSQALANVAAYVQNEAGNLERLSGALRAAGS
ncbi:MAG: hypothetical protein RL095_2547 [Verrucomicrobiota bacterium]|jgi:hypothetical protein